MNDEFERIQWLRARLAPHRAPPGLVIGIGDDAAVFDFGNRPTVVTVDTQIEGVHFRRDFLSCADVGFRALTAAASDVWAMGAMPNACVVALSFPSDFPDRDFRQLIDGLAEASRDADAQVIGGNLSGGSSLSMTTTVFGTPIGDPVRRDGAQPGDEIFVTGTIGSAALGYVILDAGRTKLDGVDGFIGRWRRPPMNGDVVSKVARIATAAVDVSDGCLQDLGHICQSSRVGAVVRADALPFDSGYVDTSRTFGVDPIQLALTGGEDYELLFTASPPADPGAFATKIGVITDDDTIRVVDSEGRPMQIERPGFRHFS